MTWRYLGSGVHRSTSGRFLLREERTRDAEGHLVRGMYRVYAARDGAWFELGEAATLGQAKHLVDVEIWNGPLAVTPKLTADQSG